MTTKFFCEHVKERVKTEFWIVGVIGGGQRRNTISKKYPTMKAHIRRKLVLLHWAKKIAQTPKYGFVGKLP